MRASRLLSILLILQLRGRVSAQALAQEFEVSVRTIFRDIDELSAAGVPVIATRGAQGGFELPHHYQTTLTGLAGEEQTALSVISLPSVAQALGLGEAAQSASLKILAALPRGSDRATRFSERIHFDFAPWYHREASVPSLPAIAQAVLSQRVVSMQYQSWQRTREWTIHPLGLVLKAGAWYVIARSDKGVTTFSATKMKSIEISDKTFVRPKRFNLQKHWQNELARFDAQLRPTHATLKLSPQSLSRIQELGQFAMDAAHEATRLANDWLQIKLPIESVDHAARQLMGLGSEFEVITPIALRKHVRLLSLEIANRNN